MNVPPSVGNGGAPPGRGMGYTPPNAIVPQFPPPGFAAPPPPELAAAFGVMATNSGDQLMEYAHNYFCTYYKL